MAPSGITFNSEQVEECDFEDDKYLSFQRLSRVTNEITHKVNINSHTLVLTLMQDPNLSPAVALRHDVDAYIWQPMITNNKFDLQHIGSLKAFGYVQV